MKKNRAGRRPLFKGAKRIAHFTLPEDIYKRLRMRAASEEVVPSVIVNRALEAELDRKGAGAR